MRINIDDLTNLNFDDAHRSSKAIHRQSYRHRNQTTENVRRHKQMVLSGQNGRVECNRILSREPSLYVQPFV